MIEPRENKSNYPMCIYTRAGAELSDVYMYMYIRAGAGVETYVPGCGSLVTRAQRRVDDAAGCTHVCGELGQASKHTLKHTWAWACRSHADSSTHKRVRCTSRVLPPDRVPTISPLWRMFPTDFSDPPSGGATGFDPSFDRSRSKPHARFKNLARGAYNPDRSSDLRSGHPSVVFPCCNTLCTRDLMQVTAVGCCRLLDLLALIACKQIFECRTCMRA